MPAAYTDASGSLVKHCTRCLEIKPATEFFKRTCKNTKDGLASWCKECMVRAKWISIAKNKDHYAVMNAEYRERTRNRKNERMRIYRKATSERNRRSRLHKYGLTDESFLAMRVKQDFKCFICGTHESQCRGQTLCVDHCHDTLVVRKLLCHHCNAALGALKESPEIVTNLLNYIRTECNNV